jgi:hypothetical protein
MMIEMKSTSGFHKANKEQAGFASLVIAMVLVLVLGLMTVGFAQLMNKEQQSALNKHLSDQAYYAAETGINDASKAVNAGFGSDGVGKQDCVPFPDSYANPAAAAIKGAASNKIGSDPGITYSCLLIDPTPTELDYGNIGQLESKYLTLQGVDQADATAIKPIKDIVISWEDPNGSHNFATVGGINRPFPESTAWGGKTSVLRVDMTPLDNGQIDRNYLIRNTYTAFLYPKLAGAEVDANTSSVPTALATDIFDGHTDLNRGGILDADCHADNKPRDCVIKVTGVGHATMLLTLRSVYHSSTVTITAYGYDGKKLGIKNAQTVIDVTGKAQDVLRRVQARISSKNGYNLSPYGLEVGSNLCKQLQLYPDSGGNACAP